MNNHCWSSNTMDNRGGVPQWVARLTRDRLIPVSREFEPHPLFSSAENFTLIA